MPTGEPNKLLERDLSRVAAKPITDIASPLLQELVNAGLMAFLRCEVEVADKGVENEDVAALILYRHMIEMVDGIQVLVLQSCGTAAIPLLRSEFEASMGLSYLLGDADRYLQRSLSWLVAHLHGAIKGRKVLDLSSQGGKEFAQFYQEEFGRVVPELSQPEIAAEIAAMERAPQNAQFSPIEADINARRHSGIAPRSGSLSSMVRRTGRSWPSSSVAVQITGCATETGRHSAT